MADFRIETVLDHASGKYYIEAYYPSNAAVPFVKSKPMYHSHEQAAADAVEIFKRGLPDQPISTTP